MLQSNIFLHTLDIQLSEQPIALFAPCRLSLSSLILTETLRALKDSVLQAAVAELLA